MAQQVEAGSDARVETSKAAWCWSLAVETGFLNGALRFSLAMYYKKNMLYILTYLIGVRGRGSKMMVVSPFSKVRWWKRSETCMNFTVSFTMQEE